MNGIPDPGGISGTFKALERTSPIVEIHDGAPATTSMRIANGTGVEHASVLRLIREHLADFEEFGRVGFEIAPFDTAGGVQRREIAILGEGHATLLLTYMRNSDVVRDFKKRLVREFYAMRNAQPAIPQTFAEALRLAADEHERAERAEAERDELGLYAASLEAPASSWNELAEAKGDYAVADAAKVLSRDPKISTGRDRLFEFMQSRRWVYRPRGGRWRAYQDQVDNGRLTEKVGKPFVRDGVVHNGDPTVRITPKGMSALHQLLGGSGQLALMAVSE